MYCIFVFFCQQVNPGILFGRKTMMSWCFANLQRANLTILNRKPAREGKYGKASQPIWILWRLQSSGLQRRQWEICNPDLSAQTKAKRRRESVWDRSPWAHRADALRNEKKAKDEKEKATAEGNQTSGLQTMAERKSDDSGEKPTKAKLRRNTSNAMEFLAERSEKKKKI